MEDRYLRHVLRIPAMGWSDPVKRGVEAMLIPPAAQYGATQDKPEQRKPSIYAGFATLCKVLQRMTDHSYLEQESGSSPLVGSLFFSHNPKMG